MNYNLFTAVDKIEPFSPQLFLTVFTASESLHIPWYSSPYPVNPNSAQALVKWTYSVIAYSKGCFESPALCTVPNLRFFLLFSWCEREMLEARAAVCFYEETLWEHWLHSPYRSYLATSVFLLVQFLRWHYRHCDAISVTAPRQQHSCWGTNFSKHIDVFHELKFHHKLSCKAKGMSSFPFTSLPPRGA